MSTSKTYSEVREMQINHLAKPTMSEDFVNYLICKVTDVLSESLNARGDIKGARLLDCLVCLFMYQAGVSNGLVRGIKDEGAVEVVGELSYLLEFK